MAGRAVDDGTVGHVLAVVDHDRPDVDEAKERDVREFLQGENKRKDVVRQRLRPAVHRVEGVRCVRRRHDPFVVRLVQGFVQARMVQAAVNPVDEEIGEEDKEGELQVVVQGERGLRRRVVEFGVAVDLGDEEGYGQQGHDGHGCVGLFNFEADLVLEEFGVLGGGFVEDEDVGQGGADEVDEEPEDPCYQEEGGGLSENVVAIPGAAVGPFGWLEGDEGGCGFVYPFVLRCHCSAFAHAREGGRDGMFDTLGEGGGG